IQEERNKTLATILKPEQMKRFHGIELQQQGVQALQDEKLVAALKLTADQKDQIKTIAADADKELRALRGGGGGGGFDPEAFKKMASIRKDAMDRATAVLNDEQKKVLKEELGAPFEVQRQFGKKGG